VLHGVLRDVDVLHGGLCQTLEARLAAVSNEKTRAISQLQVGSAAHVCPVFYGVDGGRRRLSSPSCCLFICVSVCVLQQMQAERQRSDAGDADALKAQLAAAMASVKQLQQSLAAANEVRQSTHTHTHTHARTHARTHAHAHTRAHAHAHAHTHTQAHAQGPMLAFTCCCGAGGCRCPIPRGGGVVAGMSVGAA
jgi:hypothetical protein